MNPGHARINYFSSGLFVAALGLTWRLPSIPLSLFVKKYGADALWALLVYLLIRAIHPRTKPLGAGWIAFAVSVCVEFSQLYHAAWIDAMRASPLGSLVLGNVFNWPDIPAYALGIAVGVLVDSWAIRTRTTE